MLRFIAALAVLAVSTAALAQTAFSPATRQVELLAPQLVAFSGSTGNFESLVTGLTAEATVTLVTIGADGSLQIVTFVPGTTLSAVDAARVLETARQGLVARGVAMPTAQQIAASLMGGTITTASGSSAIRGALSGTTMPSTPIHVRTDAAPLQGSARPSNLSPAEFQAVRNALATGSGVTLKSGAGMAQSASFAPTGVRMSDFEVNQALALAATLLAQQGILNPTAGELRAALFGGTVQSANGASVALQGVLQGRVRNTSDSRDFSVSASGITGISASPTPGTSALPLSGANSAPPTPGANRLRTK